MKEPFCEKNSPYITALDQRLDGAGGGQLKKWKFLR